MKMKIFVVILNWNGYKDTTECLNSLKGLDKGRNKLEIVVVDNNSVDGSVERLRKKKGFELLENADNLGYAGGNNVGIKYAMSKRADWILILNNDTRVDKELLVYLTKAANKHKKTGILSPKIYFEKGYEFHKSKFKKSKLGKVIWYAGGEIDWNNVYATNRGVDEVDQGQYDKEQKLEFATGACMMIRAAAIKEVGIFNEKYFMYLEDADLSQRMKEGGWEVWYIPKAKLWHKVAQSSGIGSGLNDYYLTRNRLMFALRYAPMHAKMAVIKESFNFALAGREWQKKGAMDFYLRKFGKGSWKS